MLRDDNIEVRNHRIPRGRFRSVLFDFDGTLSLIREGWPNIMIPMMVEIIRETGSDESLREVYEVVEDFVMRLNGRQTIYQMIQLADEVRQRGGKPLQPIEYKRRYHALLGEHIKTRIAALESGQLTPAKATVPGSHSFLAQLRERGLTLYLASGTDLPFVRREAELLQLTPFFGPHIYGALDDYENFSKKLVIDQILAEHQLQGDELLAFGDGFVEIEEVKRVGGVAVGVASDEVNRCGISEWKRERLLRAGADLIIPDYRKGEELIKYLFGAETR